MSIDSICLPPRCSKLLAAIEDARIKQEAVMAIGKQQEEEEVGGWVEYIY